MSEVPVARKLKRRFNPQAEKSWHILFNRKAETSGLNLHKLVDLLHKESLQTTMTLRLSTDKIMNWVGKKRLSTHVA